MRILAAPKQAESLLMVCATKADSPPDVTVINGSKEKLFASEMAVDVTDKAVQVLGGHSYAVTTSLNVSFEMPEG